MRVSSIVGPSGEPLVIEERPKPNNYWWQVFEASDRRDFRTGFFYFPTLKPSEQMDWLTVRAIQERSDYLYKNVPAFAMVIDGLSLDEVGTGSWPKWQTSNGDFNKEVTDAFHYLNRDPRIFSADGRTDYYSAQFNIRRALKLYGDCFGQFIRGNDRPDTENPSWASNHPCLNILPGYQVENYGDLKDQPGWYRGVQTDQFNRITKYMLQDKTVDKGYRTIDGADMLHFFDPMLPGQIRGMPLATSIAKKMFRREDVLRAMHNGTLSREMLGFAIESDGDVGPGPQITIPGARQIKTETTSSADEVSGPGKATAGRFTVQQFFGFDQENRISIPELKNGAKFRTLESNRPGTQVFEMLDSILRELAWAAKHLPEYVFFIAAGRQGTNVRVMLKKTNNTLAATRYFQLKPQFCDRWPTFWVWNYMIRPGRVKATVPDDWWKYKSVPLPDMSVDVGREGRLYDSRVESNKMSITEYHGLSGEDAEDVEDENLAVMDRRLKKLIVLNRNNKSNLTYFDVWPRSAEFSRNPGAADPGTAGAPAPGGDPSQPVKRNKRKKLNGSRL